MALTTAVWQQHIEAWQAGGLTQAAYCRQHGLNANTFSGRLQFHRPPPTPVTPALVPVRLESADVATAGPLRLRTASGHLLELPPSCEPRWLAELLRCLG